MDWEAVIGLEVHVQLKTRSKIFSGAPTTYGAHPNQQATMIDLAIPGTLPVLNAEAVRMAIKFGLAIDAELPPVSVFARKNYFYPDLPKGYQISQFEQPIVGRGLLKIELEDGSFKHVGVTRAHLEEDAGKSVHGEVPGFSGIDLNRAGVPLLEVVSEPEMSSAKEAVAYLKTLHTLVRYLDICDGNMQEGSFRCDANVSVRKRGSQLGTRAEIKNVNSFRFVEKAINYEIARQIELLEAGQSIVQETRLYDSDKDETRSMRTKSAANDYRYFPDPDLLPLVLSSELIDEIKAQMPELPEARYQRFTEAYGLSPYDAGVLTSQRGLADYFEATLKASSSQAKLAANWIMGDLLAALNKDQLDIEASPVTAEQLASLLRRIDDKTLSGKLAKDVFEALWQQLGSVDDIIEQKGLVQITDESALLAMIDEVMQANPNQLTQYRAGKDKLFGFFVGQIMKASQGKANPEQINSLLKTKLSG